MRGSKSRRDAAWPLLLAAALPLAVFAVEGHVGLGRADEGFLWYGAQRVLAGDVPQRDFQSYDVARYYWCAAWMRIAGSDGIVALRFANAVLAAATVAIATSLTDRVRSNVWLVLAAATVTLWMVPDYKTADSFAAVLLVAGLSRLLKDCGPRGATAFGLCLGVAATIGINHALYGTIGGLLAYGTLALQRRPAFTPRALGAAAVATVVGYAPVLCALAFVPGFAAAFVDAIRLLFEAGTTNVELPMPDALAWFGRGDAPAIGALRESVLGLLYLATPLFVCVGLAIAYRQRQATSASPVFVAALLLAIPYAHYFWSSAGIMHAAVAGLPPLIAVFNWPIRTAAPALRATWIVLAAVSALLFVHARTGYPWLRGRPLETLEVRGDRLHLPPDAAAEVRLVQRLVAAHPGRPFFAAHDWPGAYAVAGQRAPNWEIFQIFRSLPARQRREIERIAAADVGFVLLTTGREGPQRDGLELTHPDILRYLQRCFVERPAERELRVPAVVLEPLATPCPVP